MIDVHTHLEQRQYDGDREEEIARLKEKLKAVVNCCTHPRDFNIGSELATKHKGFIHLSAGVHPMYVDLSDKEFNDALDWVKENKNIIVSVGESGLDYFWVKSEDQRKLQRERFIQTIDFARSLKKPLTIHCRNMEGQGDASSDLVKILDDEGYHNVHWHLFKYSAHVKDVLRNNWKISVGPLVLNSKSMAKIVKGLPMGNIMLETDSPWWGGSGRGTSLNIIKVAEKIAEIKELSFEEVWKKCRDNAVSFFNLE